MSIYILYGVLPILIGLLIGYVLFQYPSKNLKKKVNENREKFVGENKTKIIEYLGVKPEKVEQFDDYSVCTFGAGNFYNIKIKFDNNDTFVKIVEERDSLYSIRGNN